MKGFRGKGRRERVIEGGINIERVREGGIERES